MYKRVKGYRLEAGSRILALRDVMTPACDGIRVITTRPWFFTTTSILAKDFDTYAHEEKWTISLPDADYSCILFYKRDACETEWETYTLPANYRYKEWEQAMQEYLNTVSAIPPSYFSQKI